MSRLRSRSFCLTEVLTGRMRHEVAMHVLRTMSC